MAGTRLSAPDIPRPPRHALVAVGPSVHPADGLVLKGAEVLAGRGGGRGTVAGAAAAALDSLHFGRKGIGRSERFF